MHEKPRLEINYVVLSQAEKAIKGFIDNYVVLKSEQQPETKARSPISINASIPAMLKIKKACHFLERLVSISPFSHS